MKALLLALLPLTLAAANAPLKSPDFSDYLRHPSRHSRVADQGNGTYLNPVLGGDRPDPSILREGEDYYLVHSSFQSTPGLLVWHSRDLVNWEPLGYALDESVGDVWAPDLCKHGDTYYIYFPAITAQGLTNRVVHAKSIRGPWSKSVDLKLGHIDPGHAVDDKGQRWLFLSAGHRVRLSEDGLSVTGPVEKVYDGWAYPPHWDVETFAQEGPKILRRGAYYYMILAEGGTAGPATSHMVIMARSKSLDGPWENSPYNPVIRTQSATDRWWSKGHASLVEGPDSKQWYMIYHGYENGHYNLGRQTLLEPVDWTEDGWILPSTWDVSRPIPKPLPEASIVAPVDFSDDFSESTLRWPWTLFRSNVSINERLKVGGGELVMRAEGQTPRNSAPLCFITGDLNYELQVEAELTPGASAGLLLFYSDKLFAGLGLSSSHLLEYGKGETGQFPIQTPITGSFYLKLRLANGVMTTWYSRDGETWTRHWMQFEVSSYHHNVAGGFLSLRPALVATGEGEVKFRKFIYRPLP